MLTSLQQILTVSDLTAVIRARLEQSFPDVWVEGEVSNLRTPSSGHFYFTLKDATSQIRAVMFRTSALRLRFALREGLHVIVRGRVTVYEPRGEYQLTLDYVEPKGIGALQIAFEQLKDKLGREGLFDLSRKRQLPFLPRCVGIVTSISGAAIRDMLTILHRRCAIVSVRIEPVPVQGFGAAQQIAAAIERLGRSGAVDVVIVGRGGGSWEDLWCFNEEVVVRAIAACPVPVVSAVGHETDVTLADFAADHRAPTPSAAAEAVVPVLEELVRDVRDLRRRQEHAMRGRIATIEHRVSRHCEMLQILVGRLHRHAQRVDEAVGHLDRTLRRRVASLRHRLGVLRHGVMACSPRARLSRGAALVPQLMKRLEEAIRRSIESRIQSVSGVTGSLQALSPLAILARGYGIVQTATELTVVKHAGDVHVGERLRVRLADGALLCEVKEILSESQRLT